MLGDNFFKDRDKILFFGALAIGLLFLLFSIKISLGAPNFNVFRTLIPEADNTYDIGSSTNPIRRWQNFHSTQASTTWLSVFDNIYVGGTATSTIFGSSTSTFPNGIRISGGGLRLSITSCSGSSALNVDSNGGVICGSVSGNPPNLIYRTLSTTKYYTASTSATDALAWHFNNGFVSSASSTIAGALNIQGGALTLGTALGATNGGTGQSTWATGDILYSSATDALSKLTAGTRGTILSITTSGIPGWISTSTFAHLNAAQVFTSPINASSTLHVTGNTFIGTDGNLFVNSSAPTNTARFTANNGAAHIGFATSTPNDNATTTTAGVLYAAGAIRNQMCNLTDATTIFVDGNCGNRFYVLMAGNRIVEFHHFYQGQTGILTLQQDATGSRIPTKWIAVNPAGTRRGVVWRRGATTTLSTAANRIDKIGFEMGTDTIFMIASSTNFTPIDY